MVPQLLTNPPISVIVVGWVRMNSGPTNWWLRIATPLDPNTLNRVAGVAAPRASSSERVDVPTTSAVRPRPRLAVSLGPAVSWQAEATRAVRPRITNVLIVTSARFELPCLSPPTVAFRSLPVAPQSSRQLNSGTWASSRCQVRPKRGHDSYPAAEEPHRTRPESLHKSGTNDWQATALSLGPIRQ